MTFSFRRALIPAAVLALGLVLSGCASSISTSGTDNGSDAAVVGNAHIANSQLEADVSAVLTAEGKPTNTSDASLVSQTLNWLVVSELLEQVAVDNDIVVTQGDIDRERANEVQSAGSEAALQDAYLKQQVAPEQINDRIRFALLAQKIAAKIAPGQTSDAATTALITTVVAKSNALDPKVNPRYGSWDSTNLQITTASPALSTPLPTASPTGLPVQ